MEFSEDDRRILERHVTNVDGDIYALYNLPPEVVAVLFAYVSRSPASFRENLLKLIKSKDLDMGELITTFKDKGIEFEEARRKAKEFHEKWVVGYGHSSVSEHAFASIAIENVSILATKVIEDNRLASYTEKSTRYQVFDRNRYYKPPRLMESDHGKKYEDFVNSLFDFYTENMPKMMEFVRKKHPMPEGMNERLYESISKARACDVMRYALPAATLTNLGMTINARALEHAIRKLLSHPLEEMNGIGKRMKEEVTKIIPTLVKYADRNDYIAETNRSMESLESDGHSSDEKPVSLVEYDHEAENKLISAILYRYSEKSYSKIRKEVESMNSDEKAKVMDGFLGKMGKHDIPLRELEHVYYTFDILVDYGAFRDIQRHRMCTQTNQDLTTRLGYSIPKEIEETGLKDQYVKLMEKAKETFEDISREFPKEAQYMVPLAFKKRTLITWNLRELFWFIRLRSGKEGHESYRRIACQIYDELERVHPILAKYITVERMEGPAR
ncbi:MAG: FAD-dependent thymidylate synthase [Candidatus Aenigmarchaeota archaeon]|nr:FAD-dependent thymidylate synthase [Candidatus Aenigmarchaeota archaeon]